MANRHGAAAVAVLACIVLSIMLSTLPVLATAAGQCLC